MRIAFISDHASPLATLGGPDAGGQNVYVAETAKHLAAMGHEIDVYTRRDDASVPGCVEWTPGVRVHHVPAGPAARIPKEEMWGHMASFTDWMIQRLNRERPDVVHAHFWMSGAVAVEIERALGVPFVVTFHALGRIRRRHLGADDGFPDERIAVEESVIAAASRVIAECPQDEHDLIQLYEADPASLSMIPCGVSPEQFRPIDRRIARRTLGMQGGHPQILSVGRMVPRKGVDTIIEAVALLRDKHGLHPRLSIVGGDRPDPDPVATPEIGRLMGIARGLGVDDAVSFTGHRSRRELAYHYSAADVFVTTPWYEPFGITPLEAMACGTPVVGSAVGGIKYTLRDRESGLLVPPRDPEAVADRIAELTVNPRLAAMLAEEGLRRARDLFSWSGVSARLAEVYAEVVGEDDIPDLHSVEEGFDSLIEVLTASRTALARPLTEAADLVADTILSGRKVLVAGNGGSAAESQHLAAELVGRFRVPGRRGLPVVSLNADTAILTAWANDVGFDDVFARQVEALGTEGDLLIGLSTSGNSNNLVQACRSARAAGLRTLGLLGRDGGTLRALVDLAVIVPSGDTQRIQEVQGLVVHLLSGLVEDRVVQAERSGVSRLPSPVRTDMREAAGE